ncbi:uncharacterized protein LOC120334584 [Styela clava]|uniref:uncharacterized protein LOC120334584 n=1 Tax=Styela clava TaxID=7725 RepID=UPI00193ACE77|nr:uncharacterized protein LOC120334584 [Styela clava]
MSFASNGGSPGGSSNTEPDEYNLYLGFMIPIGAILALCIICLLVISWQLICPKCSRKFCPKVFADSFGVRRRIRSSNEETGGETEAGETSNRRSTRTSITLVRRYSDFPPSYETLLEQPPSYDSVVIIEEETSTTGRGDSRRNSAVRTYVYDPMRRVSIEVHDEDTIRVVEELLSRRRSSSYSSLEPPGYGHVVRVPDKYPAIQCPAASCSTHVNI